MSISNKNILVLGFSPNHARTSFMASKLLKNKGYNLFIQSNKDGKIEELEYHQDIDMSSKIDVVTIFLNPQRQKPFYDSILALKPKSIIFNPGSENQELEELAKKNEIKIISCCTIALTAVGIL